MPIPLTQLLLVWLGMESRMWSWIISFHDPVQYKTSIFIILWIARYSNLFEWSSEIWNRRNIRQNYKVLNWKRCPSAVVVDSMTNTTTNYVQFNHSQRRHPITSNSLASITTPECVDDIGVWCWETKRHLHTATYSKWYVSAWRDWWDDWWQWLGRNRWTCMECHNKCPFGSECGVSLIIVGLWGGSWALFHWKNVSRIGTFVPEKPEDDGKPRKWWNSKPIQWIVFI